MPKPIHPMNQYAQAFVDTIKDYLTTGQCMIVDALNETERDDLVCHTHDFCDANMAMMAAFEVVDGCEPDIDSEQWQADASAAWTLAKRIGFSSSNVALAIGAFLHCKHPSDLEERRAMIEAVMTASRAFCIDWLAGNDHHGCYTDADMEAEGWEPMTLPQARSLLIATLLED